MKLVGMLDSLNVRRVVISSPAEIAESQHQPWIDRVMGCLRTAYAALDPKLVRMLLPHPIDISADPALKAFSAQTEQLPEDLAAPPHYGMAQGVKRTLEAVVLSADCGFIGIV